MAKLITTNANVAALLAAADITDDAQRKAVRKAIFNALRTCHGIPPDVKIGIETGRGDTQHDTQVPNPTAGAIYVKGSSPRRYLQTDNGRTFNGRTAEDAPIVRAAPAVAPQGRFTVAGAAPTSVGSIPLAAVAELLNEYADTYDGVSYDVALPAGAPALPPGGILVDNATATVYFAVQD
jgi:hypothetical protein